MVLLQNVKLLTSNRRPSNNSYNICSWSLQLTFSCQLF